ncbi:MAG: hypothetical protein ACHP78_00380 [Terriglobales bacterium]
MPTYFIYLLNIFALALPLAICEIFAEKQAGWGSGWPKNRWYAKPFAPNHSVVKLITNILQIESPLTYHVVTVVVIISLIYVCEYVYWTHNILLLLASFIGVLVFEDCFWFLFNWHFDSLKQLLKGPHGSIWWHKRWIRISRDHYLPASYFLAFSVSLTLLLLA